MCLRAVELPPVCSEHKFLVWILCDYVFTAIYGFFFLILELFVGNCWSKIVGQKC